MAVATWPEQGRSTARVEGLRLPIFIGLAYLPDIVTQAAHLWGAANPGAITHSIGFALGASVAVAWAGRFAGIGARRTCAIALALVLLHDIVDLFQAGDRMLFWPVSAARIGPDEAIIPRSLAGETAVFGAVVAGAFALNRLGGRRFVAAGHSSWAPAGAWLGMTIVACAAGTHVLRDRREDQLTQATRLLAARNYRGALAVLELAERWPSPAKPGRIDYLRGEAYAGLGDRTQAERHYLTSYSADPDYIWVIGDLAVFHAGSSLPRAERERLTTPLVERLTQEFSDHPALPRILARIDDKLNSPHIP